MNVYQKINRELKGTHVKLYKGRGYQYFVFDDGMNYETESEYMYSIDDEDVDYFIAMGRAFARRMRGESDSRISARSA